MSNPRHRDDYTVGWVCALPIELAAAQILLDERHSVGFDVDDGNVYTYGSFAGHNVVIGCLPAGQTGNSSAAAVAAQMRATFKGIQFALMVGIGGGVPSTERDIRLGDVVVSHPDKTFGGVVQYDFGKATPSGFVQTGSLNSPPQILLSAVANLRASEIVSSQTLCRNDLARLEQIKAFQRNQTGPDVLFQASYDHQYGETCTGCDTERQETRLPRENDSIVVHYGTIASGNQVMRHGTQRDRVSSDLGGVICFEMEAAGLMNNLQCLVIRGICDYADSHKNKRWQAYAAGTAAVYAKRLLSAIPATVPSGGREWPDREWNSGGNKRHSEEERQQPVPAKRSKTQSNLGSGDQNTIFTNGQTSLSEEQWQALLSSLRFERMDARQITIKSAHSKTCKWLLKDIRYLDWLNVAKLEDHNGFLWIKGKAGAGKSTLMKFAQMNARRSFKDYHIISFFFNARGEELEKSTIGAYRSLLLQLLENSPRQEDILCSLGAQKIDPDNVFEWTIELIQMYLEQIVPALGKFSVMCFIDALDECDVQQIREMLHFLEHLTDLAVSSGVRFKICFSSRHYPHVSVGKGIELDLDGEEGHAQDMTNYIGTELRIGKSKVAHKIREELQEKASGVFMWVVLVVDILNKEFDRGRVHALRRRLEEIPSDLHELFRDILTRDLSDRESLMLCIQLVLFARNPLSPAEVYHAILAMIDPEAISHLDFEDVTEQDIRRFITDSSKGLAEVTSAKQQRVQFIHESVRDFLLKENGLGNIWRDLDVNFQGQSHERLKQCCLHYIYLDCVAELRVPALPSSFDELEAKKIRELGSRRLPFLEYAVRNVLYHANVAAGLQISQNDFLAGFPRLEWLHLSNLFEKYAKRRHTYEISFLYLLAEQNAVHLIRTLAPDCLGLQVEIGEAYGCAAFAAAATGSQDALQHFLAVIRAKLQVMCSQHLDQLKRVQNATKRSFTYRDNAGLLDGSLELGLDEVFAYLAFQQDFMRLVNVVGSQRSARMIKADDYAREKGLILSEGQDEASSAALFIVLRHLHPRRTSTLLQGCVVDWQKLHFGSALGIASEKGHKELMNLILERGADIDWKNHDGQTALHRACENGCQDMVTFLLENGADVNSRDRRRATALHISSAKNQEGIAQLLLDNGADVNAQDTDGEAPLQVASRNGYEGVVRLLLDNGANVNAQGTNSDAPLYAASRNGYEGITQLLLDNGADVNAQDTNGEAPLQVASRNGYEGVVRLLLDNGANVNAQGTNSDAPLYAASRYNEEGVVRLLLNNGANVNAQGTDGETPLYAASRYSKKEVVQLLLDNGADVNASGGGYGTALQIASRDGKEGVVQLLLDNGADVNTSSGEYGTALQIASRHSEEGVVQLLLDNGADVNAQSTNGSAPLHAASRNGSERVVRLLLNNGANINAQDNYGEAPLHDASRNGYEGVVQLLLDNGADVNAQSTNGETPLHPASRNGYEGVVQILLDNGADINASGGAYGSALGAALVYHRVAIMRTLLAAGADIIAPIAYFHHKCENALDFAKSQPNSEEMVQLLLKYATVPR